MKNLFVFLLLGLLAFSFYAKEVERNAELEENAIKQVIEKAYIQGIHGNQDENIVKSGFHQEFNMLVLQEDTIEKFTVDEWLKRIENMKVENPKLWETETTYDFRLIDITGYAAVAKLDVYRGEVHFSTDYMFLYKFKNGWRIVSKIFAVPD